MEPKEIDWLALDASAKATEEQLDKPYACLNGTVYTRREFEELQNRAQVVKMRAVNALDKQISNDVRLFFENIDYIIEHRKLILADKELSESSPIFFGVQIRHAGGIRYNVKTMLQKWLDGSGKRICPNCGNEAYLFSEYSYGLGNIYCPICKEFNTIDIRSEEHLKRISDIAHGRVMEDTIKRSRPSKEERAIKRFLKSLKPAKTKPQKKKKKKNNTEENKLCSFRELSERWKKYEENAQNIPLAQREASIARSKAEVVEMHGWNIEGWLRKIAENEVRLRTCEDIAQGRKLSDVGKFLARLRKLERKK